MIKSTINLKRNIEDCREMNEILINDCKEYFTEFDEFMTNTNKQLSQRVKNETDRCNSLERKLNALHELLTSSKF